MLTQQTIEKLHALRLRGMAEALREQQEDANVHHLSFEERLGLLVDRQWNWRQNRALERRLRNGRLQGPACVEDIDFRSARGLDRPLVRSLTAESSWVREHQNLFLFWDWRSRRRRAHNGLQDGSCHLVHGRSTEPACAGHLRLSILDVRFNQNTLRLPDTVV